jgi:hypothetical protein
MINNPPNPYKYQALEGSNVAAKSELVIIDIPTPKRG